MSAAAIDLVSQVSIESVIKSFQSGVHAVIKYGKAQQGDRTMVGCIFFLFICVPIQIRFAFYIYLFDKEWELST